MKRGRWTREPFSGWKLDDTDLALIYDRDDRSGELRGCWMLVGGGRDASLPVDHYLDAAMRWVEESVHGGLELAINAC